MSIANQIQRIKTNITNAYNEIEKFNVNVTEYNNKSDKLVEAISKITISNNSNQIPSAYTELEYLSKTSGSGYIDLFFKATDNTKIELDFVVTGYNGNTANSLFGYRGGNNYYSIGFYSSTGIPPRAMSFNIGAFSDSQHATTSTILNTRYNVKMSKYGTYINDVLVLEYSEISTFTTLENCYLFKSNNYDRDMYSQIYSLKVWESDILVHDYIPVKRNDSGQYGMYDKITGCFNLPNTQTGFSGIKKVQMVTLTINPIPANATVTLTADGYTQEGNSITVEAGTEVAYSVSCDEYVTQNDTVTVDEDDELSIILTSDHGNSWGGGDPFSPYD